MIDDCLLSIETILSLEPSIHIAVGTVLELGDKAGVEGYDLETVLLRQLHKLKIEAIFNHQSSIVNPWGLG
jgi:hypothetical protein